MTVDSTPQKLDPLGTYAVWLFPPIVGSIAILYAIAATLWHSDQIVDARFAALGIALVVLSSAVFTWTSLPRRAPLSGAMFVGILTLAVLGSFSFTAATWGRNEFVQDDWGQIVTGVLFLAMAQLRPVREIVIAGIAVACLLGLAAAVQAGFLAVPVSPVVYGLVAATPPIALAFGAAAYARSMLKATVRWQNRARAGMQALEPQMRESVARSVQQEFVTVLNRDAVPLLERILAHGEITPVDSDAAAAVARRLRVQAVDTLESSWLDDSARRAGIPNADAAFTADANRHALSAVTTDQRAVFGALLMALTHSAEWTVASARVTVVPEHEPQLARLTLVADIEPRASRGRIRRELMPYLSVLRVTSTDARLRIESDRIEVGFCYDLA